MCKNTNACIAIYTYSGYLFHSDIIIVVVVVVVLNDFIIEKSLFLSDEKLIKQIKQKKKKKLIFSRLYLFLRPDSFYFLSPIIRHFFLPLKENIWVCWKVPLQKFGINKKSMSMNMWVEWKARKKRKKKKERKKKRKKKEETTQLRKVINFPIWIWERKVVF